MEPLSDNLIASHPHMNTAPSAFSVSNYLLNTLFLTETSSVPTVLQYDLRSCSCTLEEKTFSIVVNLKTTQATGEKVLEPSGFIGSGVKRLASPVCYITNMKDHPTDLKIFPFVPNSEQF